MYVTRRCGETVNGWQPDEDAVETQSQRLVSVSSVLSDTVEQCCPGIGASSCRVCILDALRHVKPVKIGV